jgi:hypothetical protein
MSKTNIRHWVFALATAGACGVIGWWFGRSTSTSPPAIAVAQAGAPAPHTLLDPGPVIVVAPDGRVTLHVDHESLQWVLAEIERQGGAHVSASTASDAVPTAREEPHATVGAAHADDVIAHVLRGTEPERYATLVQAQNGGAVSEDVLKTLYQTDASPRVRLLAFDYAQEGTEADPAARRSELSAARLLPDPVVSQEATRLLEALDRADHAAARQAATN